MCARFTLHADAHEIARLFDVDLLLDITPRYNIAPTQQTLVIRQTDAGRTATMLRWGLIPSWAYGTSIGAKLINARSETVADRPTFRAAWRAKRRCLIPADGFYEWQTEGKHKKPFRFRRPDNSLFAFAGLWESWAEDDKPVESCTILTTSANNVVGQIHNRMPVIFTSRAQFADWLTADDAAPLLRPLPDDAMVSEPVSDWVNNSRHEGPNCLAPATDEEGGQRGLFD
jgi:putative SOS response-associated peptidase YedK